MDHFSPELGSPTSLRPSRATRWRVILYNDNRNRFDDVVSSLEEATACQFNFAIEICHVCQEQGRAVCFQGSKEACHQVTTHLRKLKLQAEVDDY